MTRKKNQWVPGDILLCERTGVSSMMALASSHLSSSRVSDIEELDAAGVCKTVRRGKEFRETRDLRPTLWGKGEGAQKKKLTKDG